MASHSSNAWVRGGEEEDQGEGDLEEEDEVGNGMTPK